MLRTFSFKLKLFLRVNAALKKGNFILEFNKIKKALCCISGLVNYIAKTFPAKNSTVLLKEHLSISFSGNKMLDVQFPA